MLTVPPLNPFQLMKPVGGEVNVAVPKFSVNGIARAVGLDCDQPIDGQRTPTPIAKCSRVL